MAEIVGRQTYSDNTTIDMPDNNLFVPDAGIELSQMSPPKMEGCNSCVGACCRANMAIPLARSEADLLYDAGTRMRIMARNETQGRHPGRSRKFYLLESDCGNLDQETGTCKVYERRPRACSEFEVGSLTCQVARVRQGVTPLGMPGIRPTDNPAA